MDAGIDQPRGGASARHPRAVALLVCGRIIRDALTGRTSLVDLFQEVSSSRFPVTIPTVSVYARLTDAEGFYVLMLDVVRRDDLLEVAGVAVGDFEATDPLEDAEIMVHQIGLRLPSAGAYDIRLWANAHFVHSVSFRALD
jgi:hypothetical protein